MLKLENFEPGRAGGGRFGVAMANVNATRVVPTKAPSTTCPPRAHHVLDTSFSAAVETAATLARKTHGEAFFEVGSHVGKALAEEVFAR